MNHHSITNLASQISSRGGRPNGLKAWQPKQRLVTLAFKVPILAAAVAPLQRQPSSLAASSLARSAPPKAAQRAGDGLLATSYLQHNELNSMGSLSPTKNVTLKLYVRALLATSSLSAVKGRKSRLLNTPYSTQK